MGGRTSMQASLVLDHRIEHVRIINCSTARWLWSGALSRQSFDNLTQFGCLCQAVHLLLVAQHAGKSFEHLNVFVRGSSNPHHKMNSLPSIPRHSCRYLHYRNSVTFNQITV